MLSTSDPCETERKGEKGNTVLISNFCMLQAQQGIVKVYFYSKDQEFLS